jgi:thiol-disulfide isomerase/thioredoxin
MTRSLGSLAIVLVLGAFVTLLWSQFASQRTPVQTQTSTTQSNAFMQPQASPNPISVINTPVAPSNNVNAPTTQTQTQSTASSAPASSNTPVAQTQVQTTPQAPIPKSSNSNAPLAPNFSVTTIDKAKFTLADKKGKVVGILFMAGWCGSCLPEANAWGQLYAKYRDKGLEVLIMDVEQSDEPADLRDFKARAEGGDHAWAIDKNFTLVQAFRVRSLDTTIIIGRDGRIVYRDEFPTSLAVLERVVAEVLQ